MFKGLKSKLEDEAKRFSATASNVASQIRSGASDAGSDISGYTKKLFAVPPESNPSHSGQDMMREENIISLDDDVDGEPHTSAILKGLDHIPERVRRLSDASIESNESSLSALYGSVLNTASAPKLETISSDLESASDGGWEAPESATNDQLKGLFDNVRGRAVNYREKYRDLVKKYNQCVQENEKLKLVLTRTQDKTLKRIEKLREDNKKLQDALKNDDKDDKIKSLTELLERCRDVITTQKSKLATLTAEKNQQKESEDLNVDIEKINSEWKGRIDHINEDFAKRLADSEEKTAIAIATSKAESHEMLQQKDQEIEKWINKCHKLEKETDASKKYEQQLNGLHKTIAELETEKADMVQKLSHAKQEGVKLVQEQEHKKLEDLRIKHHQKIAALEAKISQLQESKDVDNQTEDENQKKIDQLNEKIQALQSTLEENTTTIYVKNEEIEALQQMIAGIESEKEAAEQRIVQLNESISEMTAQHQTLNDLHKDSDARTKNVMLQIDDLLGKISALELAITKKDEAIEELNKRLAAEKDAVQKLNQEMEQLEKDKDEAKLLTEYSERLKNYFQSIDASYDSQDISTLDDMIERCTASFGEYLDQLGDKTSAALEAVKSETKNLLDESKKEIDQLQSKLSKLAAEHSDLKNSVAANDTDEEVSRLRSEFEKLKNAGFEERVEKLTAEVDVLSVENERLKKELEAADSTEELNALKAQLENVKSQNFEIQIEELKAEVDQLAKTNSELDKQLASNDQTDELERLQEEISKVSNETSILKEDLKAANSEKEETSALLEELKAALEIAKQHAENVILEKEHAVKFVNDIEDQLQGVEFEGGVVDKIRMLVDVLKTKSSDLKKLQEEMLVSSESLVDQQKSVAAELALLKETTVQLKKDKDEAISNHGELVSKLQNTLNLDDASAVVERVHELAESVERLEEVEASIQSYMKINEKLAQDKSKLMTAVEQISAIVQYEGDENGLVEKVQAFFQELSEKNAQIAQSAANYNNAKEQLEFIEKEMEMYKSDTTASDLEAQISVLKEEAQYRDSKLVQMMASESKLDELLSVIKSFTENENIFLLVNDVARSLSERDGEVCAAASWVAKKLSEEHSANAEEFGRVKALEEKVSAAEKQRESAENQYSELQKSHEDLRIQYIQKEKFVEELHVELGKLEKELKTEREMASNLTDEFEDKKSKFEEQLLAKSSELAVMASQLQEFEVEKVKLKTTIETLEETVLKLTSNEDDFKNQLSKVQDNLKTKESEIESLKDSISEAQDSLTEIAEGKRKDELATENNNKKLRLVERELREVCESLEFKTEEVKKKDVVIKDLEEQLLEALDKDKHNGFVDDSGFDAMIDQEELCSLKVQVEELKDENNRLNKEIKELSKKKQIAEDSVESALEMRSVVQQMKAPPPPAKDKHFNGENARFAEPTEAEYLRNVLYRYMVERETLGKEIVTLAKVICKVLKFSPTESSTVLQREEARTHGWIGDTVGSVFQR